MRKIVLLAPLALIAACSQSEPALEPTEEAAPAAEVVMAIDGKPVAGTFEVTSADGKTVIMEAVNADGTFTNVEGDTTTTGTWTSTGPGNYCATADGEAETNCYSETMEDGVYTSVNEKNPEDAWTLKRLS